MLRHYAVRCCQPVWPDWASPVIQPMKVVRPPLAIHQKSFHHKHIGRVSCNYARNQIMVEIKSFATLDMGLGVIKRNEAMQSVPRASRNRKEKPKRLEFITYFTFLHVIISLVLDFSKVGEMKTQFKDFEGYTYKATILPINPCRSKLNDFKRCRSLCSYSSLDHIQSLASRNTFEQCRYELMIL